MDESSGAAIAVVVVAVLLGLGLYVFSSIALGKVFLKLGEQAWKAWVPIVNTITLLELGRYSALWVIGMFIPAANLVALVVFIMAVNNVNRRLGHGGGFTLLYLISFPIWAGVLGFGKSVDTGWMPGIAATGYVPFAPVTLLSLAPAQPAVPTPVGHNAAPSMPLASVPPAPPAPAAQFAGPPLPPAPPAAFAATAPPAPPAPAAPHGLPTSPPPFYVSAPPAPPVFSAPPAVPVLSAPAVVPAPPAPPAPPVLPAPPAPPVASAPPAPPVVAAPPVAAAAPANPWAPPAPVVQVSAAPVAAAASGPGTAELPMALPGELAAAAAEIAAGVAVAAVPAALPAPVAAEVDDEAGDDLDETMIVARRMKPWTLETEHGLKVSLTKPVVLLGRNPARGGAHTDAQLVPLHDPGKTVSKTHARLDFVEGAWGISDLHSTNGVVLIDGGGLENELDAGASAPLTDRFLLGELAARIYLEA